MPTMFSLLADDPILQPVRKALTSFEKHLDRILDRILQRWSSSHSNARLEGLNGLFQAARARARGYRNTTTFATMIYLMPHPWKTSSNPLETSKNPF